MNGWANVGARLSSWFRPRRWVWLALACALVLPWAQPRLSHLDLLVYDWLTPVTSVEPESRVIAIDDASLASLGRWPWPRELHARLINRLRSAGVKVVAYDVLFSEASTDDGDRALVDAFRQVDKLVVPVAALTDPERGPYLLENMTALSGRAAPGLVDSLLDIDGHWRRMHLSVSGLGRALQAMPLVALQMTGDSRHQSVTDAAGYSESGGWLRSHEIWLPASSQPVPQVSFLDALRDPAQFAGRVVFVGVTARGLGPEYVLSSGGRIGLASSPVVMAHTYEVLRAGAQVQPVSPWLAWSLAFALALPLCAWPVRPAQWWGKLWPLLTVLLPGALCWLLLQGESLWFAPMTVTLVLLLSWLTWGGNLLMRASIDGQRLRRQAQATLQAVGEGVVVLGEEGRIRSANRMAQQMSSVSDMQGAEVERVFQLDDEGRYTLARAMVQCRASAAPVSVEQPIQLRMGDICRDILVTVAPLPAEDGGEGGLVLALRDVTATVVAGQQLRHAATHDALTGLPNRSLLRDRLEQAITRAVRGHQSLALLFMDLDRFKRINDSLGHVAGDEVLREVSRRLLGACRKQDTVARWGGDEFVIVLEDMAGREAAITVINKIIHAVSGEVSLSGMVIPCACSVGVAMAPDDGMDPDALLAMADAAMYRAKSHPTQRWEFFSSSMNLWTRDRLALESEARQALSTGGFELFYQPQVDRADGRLVGFEALLRWRRPDGSLMLPAEFIGMAEESSLILALGEWTLRTAARQIADWSLLDGPDVPVSVNVSARQCLDLQLVDLLKVILAETGISPDRLKLEITETAAMGDAAVVEELLEGVRKLGVGIALDDFGTGYSSLVYLRRFPIQQIKIDRSFVQDLCTTAESAAIVKAIIGMAHGLGVPVVAEGVETPEQRDILLAQGCDILQGYFYARPLPAVDAARWGGRGH